MNRLANESSPYLLQHADNPVEWFPWGDEALQLAKAEDKPILLSIGYAACHWCHVMAHESFEDPATAALMNEHFINIKVDREERPDLDKIYQLAHNKELLSIIRKKALSRISTRYSAEKSANEYPLEYSSIAASKQ